MVTDNSGEHTFRQAACTNLNVVQVTYQLHILMALSHKD